MCSATPLTSRDLSFRVGTPSLSMAELSLPMSAGSQYEAAEQVQIGYPLLEEIDDRRR
jgi:hypothetical protein